jgi:polyisoprenoid-binding protein YceI
MSRMPSFALIAALALIGGGSLRAQTMTVRPESRVILLGRSNVHGFSCATSTFQANIGVNSSNLASRPRSVRLTVAVPVRSLDCGRARMNQDMFRALKADSFPEIRYVLTSYLVNDQLATTDSFTVNSVGELTVAGKTQRVDLQVKGARDHAGVFRGDGGVRLLMTDFGIKPPTAFFGAIRTKNALEVRVEIRVTRSDVVALRK